MQPNPTQQTPALPEVEPVVADGIPAADPEPLPLQELIGKSVRRLSAISVPHSAILTYALVDPSCQRILRDIHKLDTGTVPSRAELEIAKKQVELAIRRLHVLRSQRGRRAAMRKTLESQLYQRVTTIQEKAEKHLVAKIKGKLGPRYNVLPMPPTPASESPSATST